MDVNSIGAEACPFIGFGPSAFLPRRSRTMRAKVVSDLRAMRSSIRTDCPNRPGVYGFISGDGCLIYVGVSCHLRKRLVTYFQGSGELNRKERRIASHARQLVWEKVGNAFTAQLRELELIRRHQPGFNVKGREQRRGLGYLYLTGDEAPRFSVTRHVPKSARKAWGPIVTNWRIREAVETLNAEFKLCDCPKSVVMHFADQRLLFDPALRVGCVRGEIGTCLGPCAGLCSQRQYVSQCWAAQRFLDGQDDSALHLLAERLQAAVAQMEYEQAARIRDRIDRLQLLQDELATLHAPALLQNAVYAADVGRRRCWFLIRAGAAISSRIEPTSKAAARRSLAAIDTTFLGEQPCPAERDRSGARIVAAWFRKNPAETTRLISPEQARERCRKMIATTSNGYLSQSNEVPR